MSLARAISTGSINKPRPEDGAAHDWYRFVLSFPPHLVNSYIELFHLNSDSYVLDPFCGSGTTLVECKKLGIPSVGIEAHPMTHFASQVKVDWHPNPAGLVEHAHRVAELTRDKLLTEGILDEENLPLFSHDSEVITQDESFSYQTLPPETFKLLLTNSISPLPLHKTLRLLDTLKEQHDERYYGHELLALAKALVEVIGNLRFGPEVGVGPLKQDAPVVAPWQANVEMIANDLRELQALDKVPAIVHRADARQLKKIFEPNSISAVITSPPYPNEKDYTRTTRLESVLLGFINNRSDLRLFKRTLMRSNTRTVYKGDDDDQWIANYPKIQEIAETIEARRIELGKTSGFERLYATVVRLYFGGMARHLTDLRQILRSGAHLAYVVGDQASFFRIPIRTGELLAEIAESLGYKLIRRDLFRERLATATKEQLREEVVVLSWPGKTSHIFTPSLVVSHKGSTMVTAEQSKANRYQQIIERVFFAHYQEGAEEVCFDREEFEVTAKDLNINLPKNLGDVIYSFRYRTLLPSAIRTTAPEGKEWIIRPAGRSRYCFALTSEQDITPNARLSETKIPDSTPGLVTLYSLNDEQALLAKLRYNRLIDIFTGITCYSLQNHLRTFLPGIGQVETDEIYVGVDRKGAHYVFPVQAKGAKERLHIVQIEQDFALCANKFPALISRPIGAQFIDGNLIALFEFENGSEDIKIASEKHYRLVSPEEVTPDLLEKYKMRLPHE